MANATSALTDIDESCRCPDASRAASGAKPTFLLMSGRMVAFAATFFVPVVLARMLSQAEFGTYKQIFLIYGTLYYIAQFGMAESLYYFLPSAPRQAGRYLANTMLCLAVGGLGCVVLLRASGPHLAQWLNNPALAEYATWIGALLMLMMLSNVLEIAMTARGRYLLASSSYGISDLIRAAFFLVPALVFRRIDVLLYGAVAFAAVRLAVTLLYVIRTYGASFRPHAGALARQLRYTLPFGIAIVLEMCQANLHQYAVSYYFDAATFAIYAVGCLQIPFVDLVVTSAGNVMMLHMGQALREGRPESGLASWHETTRHLSLVLIPLVGLLLVSAHTLIVMLFTEAYASAAPVFMIWSLAILLSVFMTDAALRAYAETRFLLLLNAIRLATVVLLIHWSISTFHLVGAVLVTLVATLITKTLGLIRIAHLMRVEPAALVPWRSLRRTVLAAVAAAVVAWLVMTGLPWSALHLNHPISQLIVAAGVYAGVYVALVCRLGLVTEGERRAVVDRLQRWTGLTDAGSVRASTAAVPPAPVAEGNPG